MRIAFEALIKQINIKSLVTGDKEAWMTLRLQDKSVKDEILNSLNTLQRGDRQVMVVIMDKKEEDCKKQ